jgi:F0F1-type ATP synthase epsilon subunit
MPVNMDPAKKRRRQPPLPAAISSLSEKEMAVLTQTAQFGEETDEDRVKELADAERKNLWEATEVIDMDKF